MGLVAAIVTDFLNSAVSRELKVFCCTKLHGRQHSAHDGIGKC